MKELTARNKKIYKEKMRGKTYEELHRKYSISYWTVVAIVRRQKLRSLLKK
jgi:Mor family transcriptional regulator